MSAVGLVPIGLYIKDFMCYDWAYIDFTQFSAALVIAKVENNEEESNGAGKTTIFKAIEYVLFNQSNFNLERIIRDDAPFCKVVFDFTIGDKAYRLARTRTCKGSTDLSMYERTAEIGQADQVFHNDKYDPLFDSKYWKDISGRRTMDTEKDLSKLLKINFKSFRTFVHFMQHDFTSIATATPEKRKAILKDALNLIVYAKLEKMTKEKSAVISRELDRCRAIIEGLGDPETDITNLHNQAIKVEEDLALRTEQFAELQKNLEQLNEKINALTIQYNSLESKFSALVNKEQASFQSKTKLEISIREYQAKKSNIIQEARNLIAEVKQLEETQTKLSTIDYTQLQILSEKIEEKKVLVTQHNVNIKNSLAEYEELKIPMPTDSVCKHCRQPMTDQHRQECIAKDQARMVGLQASIKESKSNILKLNMEIQAHQQTHNSITLSKQHLDSAANKIAAKKTEIADKRALYDEYSSNFEKHSNELKEKEQEILQIREELKSSSIDEAKVLNQQIQIEKQNAALLMSKIATSNKEITHFTSHKAVLDHNIELKRQNKQKKADMSKLVKDLEHKMSIYPLVVQAFSSTGIPNLIIHNILDDLQVEVNNLLAQFRPGLQAFFFIEKTTGDGVEADTLDITYKVHGKDRYYEQLSGAMQLIMMFSLKLGLSFYLQKMMGVDIKFLLLDELDQSLDKARVDTFNDIIKFLQKDFTILIVTHNDRLKDKFKNVVLVEQNADMVSTARVVSIN
jgi:DNA repair exonuclease SbcCD ATPase subunit